MCLLLNERLQFYAAFLASFCSFTPDLTFFSNLSRLLIVCDKIYLLVLSVDNTFLNVVDASIIGCVQ